MFANYVLTRRKPQQYHHLTSVTQGGEGKTNSISYFIYNRQNTFPFSRGDVGNSVSFNVRVRLHASVGKIQGLGLQLQQIVTCCYITAVSVLSACI